MTSLLEIRDLAIDIKTATGWRPLVHSLSLSLNRSGALGLVGESGSGKSVSTRAVMRLAPEHSRVNGTVVYDGEDVNTMNRGRLREYRSRQVAMIHQDPRSHINPLRTVGDFLTEGVRHLPRGERRELAVSALADVGIPDGRRRMDQYPHQLSGGLLQRVMIAAAVMTGPKLLLADEPTTALDVTTQSEVMAVLGEAREQHELALLFITHDLELAAAVTDRLAVMYAGTIMEEGPTAAVSRAPQHPYTIGLLASQPNVRGARRERLTPIPGRPTAAHESGPGCPFAGRCLFAEDHCRTERPAPRLLGESLVRCHRAEDPEIRQAAARIQEES
ncbi:MAG TPA: ABC transporter ATP-binding protein [Actinospica sp.]|jgi:oligopeptide/dipeptide ABC transporter ATP-binding protein|nr:ABC transporter ATP-binding protein [Actinospica sp.]